VAIRQRLLDTPVERVSAELAKTVGDFCEPIDVIASAYVGLIEITRGFDRPEEHLGVGFELSEPVAGSEEGDRELRLVADRFYDQMPEEILQGGCNFLEPGGVEAWEEKARRVFSRGAERAT
jgi:hypothetical protein